MLITSPFLPVSYTHLDVYKRQAQGLAIEKKQCIYLRDDVTEAQIIANLLSNPVKALIESGFFFYNEDSHIFSVSPDIWSTICLLYTSRCV